MFEIPKFCVMGTITSIVMCDVIILVPVGKISDFLLFSSLADANFVVTHYADVGFLVERNKEQFVTNLPWLVVVPKLSFQTSHRSIAPVQSHPSNR